jgi:O-glycosyl hydrolase
MKSDHEITLCKGDYMLTKWMMTAALLAGVLSASGAEAERTKAGQSDPIKPQQPVEIVIHADATRPVITDFGYDVKQPGKAKAFTAEDAKIIFGTDGFTCLRIPIWGDVKHPAHPAPGKIVEDFYEPVLNAMKYARAVKPDVIFFASKRLEGKESWPTWTKDANGVMVEKYTAMLTDYLSFMHKKGFKMDLLGIDNEGEYNDGNITPEKHKAIVAAVKAFCATNGIPMPKIIGPETYGPKPDWFAGLSRIGGRDSLDFAGTHYYPKWRNPRKFAAWAKAAGGIPLWHTELHWDKLESPKDLLDEAEGANATLFDCTDHGATGFVWWAYTRKGVKGEIESALSSSLVHAQPLPVDDGNPKMNYGSLFTRAFKKEKAITLWAVNNSEKAIQAELKMDGAVASGNAAFRQWTSTGSSAGISTLAASGVLIAIPPRTVTIITVPIIGK